MLKAYRDHVAERAAPWASRRCPLMPASGRADRADQNPPAGEDAFLLDLCSRTACPGVDETRQGQGFFPRRRGLWRHPKVVLISKAKATELLGTMVGGYNVPPDRVARRRWKVAGVAAEALKKTLLMFDFFNDVATKAKAGNAKARK